MTADAPPSPGARTPSSIGAEAATVLLALIVASSAFLPSVAPQREGVLLIAVALATWSLLWFHVMPRGWFGDRRQVLGALMTQAFAAALVHVTGGAASIYFAFYWIPVLVTIFHLRPANTLIVGASGVLMYLVVLAANPGAFERVVRDAAVVRSVAYVTIVVISWLIAGAVARANARLAAERSRLAALIDALQHPVIVASGGLVETANPAAASLFGHTLVGRRVAEIMPAGEGMRQVTDATGRTVDVSITVSRLSHDTTVHAAHDVSGQAELNRMREQLLYDVAHELRGPLAILDTSLDLVTTEIGSMSLDELDDVLGTARRSVARMRTLMEDLLSAGNIQAGRFVVAPRDVAIEPVLREAIDLVGLSATQRGQRIVVELAPGLRAKADPRYVRQVLQNLLTNASKYGGDGGEITVQGERVDGSVRLTVRDRGPGIPADQRAGLFERYYRVRGAEDHGVGLGLAIAKGVIEAHGGSIGVDSDVGRGTAVWFTLPAAPEARE